MAFEHLSLEELKAKLVATQNDLVLLNREIEERHQARKGDVALEVRNLIFGQGYDLEEILPLVQAPATKRSRRRDTSGGDAARRVHPAYSDPDNAANVYTRGRRPDWMNALMVEKGYDPTDKASREAFKAHVLVRVN